ncbi:MAG TPA: tetratricopeptide repeat protein [Pyrinomonadaceae bacterium]|nr:tetratricopeptide repeat protein [Pyrinomonadaceae bacterium]
MKKAAPLLLSLAVGASAAHIQPVTANARTRAASASLYGSLIVQGRSTLTVRVYGPSRMPLNDIHVELQNDTYTTIGRARTDGAGRITFPGLADGNYKVRVLAYGTEYLEQMQDVTIASLGQLPRELGGGGGTNESVDLYLKARESASASPFAAPPGTVFAQVVPPAARKLYEKGVGELRDKKEREGFQSLRQSLEVFPEYYLALERLGTEYVTRGTAANGYYEAARILLTKALEVNPKAFPSTFGLGVAQYQLKRMDEAVETLKRATTLYANSVNAYLYLGMALKQAKRADEAETAFKRANTLGDGKAAEVHWQLARLYSEQNRYQEAADALELYLKFRTDKNDTEKVRQMIAQLREKAAKK